MGKLKQVLSRIKQMESNIISYKKQSWYEMTLTGLKIEAKGKFILLSLLLIPGGVITLNHQSTSFQLKNKCIDPSEKYTILNGTNVSTQINLISIYASNGDDPSLYPNVILY